jgi:hypothetical protein
VTPDIQLAFRIFGLWCLGIAGFYQLTAWSAPGHDEAAFLVAFILPTFGVAAARVAMNLVVLPLALLRMVLRVARGRKPIVLGEADPFERLGRVLFVVGFTLFSAFVGAGMGLFEGGAGPLASIAAFGAVGLGLAVLIPTAVVFVEDVQTGGTVSDAQRAEFAAARAAGEPTMRLVDRVVKDLREELVEDPRKP